MQQAEPTPSTRETPSRRRARRFPGVLSVVLALLILLMLVLLPPFVSVNRFQRRIASSLSQSLGRTVHLDSVTLTLLPLPGFTFTNFVVDEDPAFGSEPIIRANSVRATLRLSSLWRRRIEFSTISFDQPSVNLVHLSNGKWNLNTILLHAAHIQAAPTAQLKPGPTPRFPYIEATGARLNLKLDQEKTPYSLTDADFALWLPDPQEWHLRLKGTPARTDTDVSGAGLIQIEGTLGRAASLGQVPLNLQGEWSEAPLGESTHLLFGRDLNVRGNLDLTATILGTVSDSSIQTRLRLIDARRADFIPDHLLQVDLECLATAASDFHAFRNLRCTWPPISVSRHPMVAASGDIPDIRDLTQTTIEIGTPGIPAATLLDWLRIASSRIPSNLAVTGNLSGSLSWHPIPDTASHWEGDLLLAGAGLINPKAGRASLVASDLSLQSVDGFEEATTQPEQPSRLRKNVSLSLRSKQGTPPLAPGFILTPTMLALGGKEPAILQGHFDATGYTLHLTGMASTARLLALAAAIPQFGDGLAAALPTNRATGPYRIDLTATRHWHGPQTWTANTPTPAPAHHPGHR
ncbi:AsmA family protein [Edaphobacter sp.]|uniref:AsmA family protein n=1 Tax=Edaphobacter sp. TaxID=1934404 RepID=UPI002DB7D646|nr:AsmA family protein [Edaphobacter sp.]HEU5341325.1 AsmA family protein [Edaphobacter sp.]